MFSFGFCLPSGIGEVTAAMTCWNKVSPASPYLEGIRFNINEGHVRVCVARSVGSLRILVVGVSIKWSNCLVIGAETSTSSVVLCSTIRFLPPLDWWWRIEACVAWGATPTGIHPATTRSRCSRRVALAVFKALYGKGICRCPFSLTACSVYFSTSGGQRTSLERRRPVWFSM